MACISQDDDEFEYDWDPDQERCTQIRCTRTNLYLPYSGMRDQVLALAGDMCDFQDFTEVSRDICCEKIQKGCIREEYDVEYIGGQCLNDDCSTCELIDHPATNYYSPTDVLQKRIVDYTSLLTPLVENKA